MTRLNKSLWLFWRRRRSWSNEPNQSANPSVMLAEEWLVAPVLYIFNSFGKNRSWPPTKLPGKGPSQTRSSDFLQRFFNLLWNSFLPTTMKPKPQSNFSFWSKGYEISGQIEFLKSIVPLEFSKSIVKPVCIREVRNSLLRAAFNRLG